MHTIAPVTGRQFAWFRVIFGLYLATHFAYLIPWGAELFSRDGVLPTADLNPTYGLLPNVLALWDSPPLVAVFLVTLTGLSVLFCLGIWRRTAAVLLWYGWACLFNRNVLISNPSIPYIGMLLLLTALVPVAEPLRAFGRERPSDEFYVPGAAYWTAWALMAIGYAFSGVVKLDSPSWIDGTAIRHVLQNPLARDSWLRDVVLSMPAWVFKVLTWKVLTLELLFVPLALCRGTRSVVWLAMVGMHIGIVALLNIADLSAGMLILHLFTFDSRWPAQSRCAFRVRTLSARMESEGKGPSVWPPSCCRHASWPSRRPKRRRGTNRVWTRALLTAVRYSGLLLRAAASQPSDRPCASASSASSAGSAE